MTVECVQPRLALVERPLMTRSMADMTSSDEGGVPGIGVTLRRPVVAKISATSSVGRDMAARRLRWRRVR